MSHTRRAADLCWEAEHALTGELKRPLSELRHDLNVMCASLHALGAQEEQSAHATLFKRGLFNLHSGGVSDWKIDCDALTNEDLATIALLMSNILPAFGAVEGVPRGGLRLAAALQPYVTRGPLLIVDDVTTTGRSLAVYRKNCWVKRLQHGGSIGAVIFARGQCQPWVTPLFRQTSRMDLL